MTSRRASVLGLLLLGGCSLVFGLNDTGELCGNNTIDQFAGEECDDGNRNDGDGCSAQCTLEDGAPVCGNEIVEDGEQCDPPDGATCDDACQLIIGADCGNEIVDAGEICDDGNNVGGDGCRADCLGEEDCGDGLVDVDADEQCDDNNTQAGDNCDENCVIEACGNGILQFNEQCDDGNLTNGDGCDSNCFTENAGCDNDGDLDAGEQCDDGDSADEDGCRNCFFTDFALDPDINDQELNGDRNNAFEIVVGTNPLTISNGSIEERPGNQGDDNDFYEFEGSGSFTLTLTLTVNGENNCNGPSTPRLRILRADGQEAANNNGSCPALGPLSFNAASPNEDTLFFVVDEDSGGDDAFDYTLTIQRTQN